MKVFVRKILLVLFIISLVLSINLSFTGVSNAAVQIPEKVRIGLYFTDSSISINTAVSSFTVSAEKGLQLGSFSSNQFNALYEELTNNPVTIRKDAYYIKTLSSVKEYNPTSQTAADGEKIGPFHIQIGGSYADLISVQKQIAALKVSGIIAYPAFVDTWQVWTGFYVNEASAQADIINIQTKLGVCILNLVQPSATRITALSNNEDILLIFNSTAGVFQIHPKAENSPYMFKLNGKSNYRGELEVRRFSGSDMTLINILSIEEYLYGNIPPEIGANAPIEALKAQAVNSRVYVINNLHKHSKYGFDLCASTNCQVYKGYDIETPVSNKAIDNTKGKLIRYNDKMAQTFYFASSGGKTEDVNNVWDSDFPYLKSVDDNYESGKSWHYNWEVNLTAAKVKDIMKGKGYDLGDILSINLTKFSDAGRATEMVVGGSKSNQTYTKANCRYAFGLDSQWYSISTDADISLKSSDDSTSKSQLGGKSVMTANGLKSLKTLNNNVKIVGADGKLKSIPAIPTNYKFSGRGWGHAIGMSQEGAIGMANAGYTYVDILTHYFKGTRIE